jgi:hypothetical protein
MANIFDCGYSKIRIDDIFKLGEFVEILWYDLGNTSKYRTIVHNSLITLQSDEPIKGLIGSKYNVGGVDVDKESYLLVYEFLLLNQ